MGNCLKPREPDYYEEFIAITTEQLYKIVDLNKSGKTVPMYVNFYYNNGNNVGDNSGNVYDSTKTKNVHLSHRTIHEHLKTGHARKRGYQMYFTELQAKNVYTLYNKTLFELSGPSNTIKVGMYN